MAWWMSPIVMASPRRKTRRLRASKFKSSTKREPIGARSRLRERTPAICGGPFHRPLIFSPSWTRTNDILIGSWVVTPYDVWLRHASIDCVSPSAGNGWLACVLKSAPGVCGTAASRSVRPCKGRQALAVTVAKSKSLHLWNGRVPERGQCREHPLIALSLVLQPLGWPEHQSGERGGYALERSEDYRKLRIRRCGSVRDALARDLQ